MESLIDKKVFVRTMGAHFVGVLVAVDGFTLELDECSWVADPGAGERAEQKDVLAKGFGGNADLQPFPDRVYLNRSVVETVTEWRHALFV